MEIRPPLTLRVYLLVFGIVWTGFVVYAAIAVGATPAVVVPVLMLVVGPTLFWRLAGLVVIAHGDELVSRNLWRTLRARRTAIRDFRLEPGSRLSPRRRVEAVLGDGTLMPLDAVALADLPVLHRRRRIERGLEDLRVWLEADR